MNRWTPIAVCSVLAFAVAIGCGGESPAPPPATPPPPPVQAAPQAPATPAPPATPSTPATPASPPLTSVGPVPVGCGNQLNMQNALNKLQQARAFLDKAEQNKGGWREKAIAATETAINETTRGCNYTDAHEKH